MIGLVYDQFLIEIVKEREFVIYSGIRFGEIGSSKSWLSSAFDISFLRASALSSLLSFMKFLQYLITE